MAKYTLINGTTGAVIDSTEGSYQELLTRNFSLLSGIGWAVINENGTVGRNNMVALGLWDRGSEYPEIEWSRTHPFILKMAS